MKARYQAFVRLFITGGSGDSESAFGGGLISLLRGVSETGSLNRAAKDMHMAYSKAWKLMNSAEEHLGTQLIIRDGARGSTLTDEAVKIVAAFDTVSAELGEYATRRLHEEMAKFK